MERLHDFFGGEVASCFLLRVCVILGVESLRDFCVFVCGGCVIFCVERVRADGPTNGRTDN